MKPVIWLGSSRDDIRGFPVEARQEAGYELDRVQRGLEPSDWSPMPTVGPGVREIRVHAENEYRVFYVAKFAETVYVLHAFAKKTQQTAQRDIELAADRYRQLLAQHRR